MNSRSILYYCLLLAVNLVYGQAFAQQSTDKEVRQYAVSFSGSSVYAPFLFAAGEKADGDTIRFRSRITINGRLQVQTIPALGGGTFSQYILTANDCAVEDEGLSEMPAKEEVIRLLNKPVYLLHNDSGRVMQVYFDPALPSTFRQLWNQLIGYMQCVGLRDNTNVSQQAAGHEQAADHLSDYKQAAKQQTGDHTGAFTALQEVLEEDRVGFFRAVYERHPASSLSNRIQYRKTGKGYQSFAGQGLVEYRQTLDALYALYKGHLERVQLKEQLQVMVKEKPKAISTATFSLQEDTTGTVAHNSDAGDILRRLYDSTCNHSATLSLAAVTLSNFITRHEMRTALYKQVLGTATLPDVLQALDTLTVEQAIADHNKLNRKVAALVYLTPANLDPFMLRIDKDAALSPAFFVIVKGLAQAGTSQSLEKVAILLQRYRQRPDVVDFFTNTLLFLETPDQHFIAAVQNIAYDRAHFDAPIQEALRYLLGSFSHSLQKNNPALGNVTLLQTLQAIHIYSKRSGKEKTLEMLGIAGNAGADTALPFISKQVLQADMDIRQQALFALRLLKTAKADTLLLQEFVRDTNAVTQLNMLTIFRYRTITQKVMNAVAAMLSSVQDEQVAVNGVRLLFENRQFFPQVPDMLNKIAATTGNAAAKKEIRTLLSGR